MNLKGKVTVIVGGEGPLGRDVSKKFLSEGAKVLVGWYAQNEWEEAEGLLSDYKAQLINMQVDATKEDQVEKLMHLAKDKFGTIDILLHMVGVIRIGQLLWETDKAVLDSLIDANLKSAFLCSKHAVKIMLEKKKGRIVVFPASVALNPVPRFGAYAISKSGLITLVQVLREELKDTNITVNAVMPSVMDTVRTRHMPNADPDKWVKTSDVAKVLASLCSDEMDALSGSVLKLFGKL
jgi:NAD(P)-dependent dehydrogenase (short-subunit alcohol dehydrogenase family)